MLLLFAFVFFFLFLFFLFFFLFFFFEDDDVFEEVVLGVCTRWPIKPGAMLVVGRLMATVFGTETGEKVLKVHSVCGIRCSKRWSRLEMQGESPKELDQDQGPVGEFERRSSLSLS